ncbi:hypothetical protein [Leisingera sp. ANG-Vp]|uniref:hypothetical protein n=1 Tax=Leisingera sp. ANG-Vp TaxID=1577896 RepID=UPI001269F439|nr:hypothetical protein [Leisingera sp. ANG-Vp]
MMKLSSSTLRRLLFVSLNLAFLAGSVAIGEESSELILELDCALNNTEGEEISIAVRATIESEIQLKINELIVDAVFVPNLISHPPTITFSASFGEGVYTLVVHRDYFLPHPEGYDPSKPPASLTVQSSDTDVTPVVDVFLGNCSGM